MREVKQASGVRRQALEWQQQVPAARRIDLSSSFLTPHASRLTPALFGLMLIAMPAWGQSSREDPRVPLLLVLLLPVVLVSFTALELALWVLVPAPLTATCQAIVRGRGRCLLAGCLTVGASLAVISALGQYPGVGSTVSALLLGIVLLGGLTGVTAVAALLGQGVLELAGGTGSRALKVIAGSVLLGLAGIFPLVGWVLFIYFVLVGLGGAVLALGRSWKREK
jgi:hypothetical protein